MRARRAETPGHTRLLAAGISLHVDAVTAEAVRALRAAGIDSILLRGPVLARWLYDDETERPYIDADLLVAPGDVPPAEKILTALGFSNLTVEGVIAHDRPTYAHTWVRERDRAALDLHYTLLGVGVPANDLWEAFRGQTETIPVAGTDVDVPKPVARALIVALHAAAHGVDVGKPLDDLARAVERVPSEIWEAASALASRLEAMAAFAIGLRLLPQGGQLADRLDLPREASVERVLRATTARPMALGFDWLARTPGARAKARLVARKVAPNAGFMRARLPLARRGRTGLAAAYGFRVLWLAWHAVPGFLAWWRARRSVR